ncbi:MAG: hypothetical protein QNJ46_16155 [Leptolyngbyaceae cyanobacterium MO_188.B28]|nr:hypothetical protein [Leptolyngbyaceae cyanobacterium MO_188.B28]
MKEYRIVEDGSQTGTGFWILTSAFHAGENFLLLVDCHAAEQPIL